MLCKDQTPAVACTHSMLKENIFVITVIKLMLLYIVFFS